MSSRRRKQQVREMSRIAAEKFNARIRAYKEIVDLIKSGSDEELAARIRQAVEEKSDLRFYGAFGGYSLLHTAAENDRAEAAAILVREAGFDVDILANFNRTPLHAAGIFCAAQAAKTLISLGAEVDARDGDGNTPMQRAACYAKETDDKNFETIKILQVIIIVTCTDVGITAYGKTQCPVTHPPGKIVLLQPGVGSRIILPRIGQVIRLILDGTGRHIALSVQGKSRSFMSPGSLIGQIGTLRPIIAADIISPTVFQQIAI